MSQIVEDFDVGVIYPLRTYERHQFSLSIHGKAYKGDYCDEVIHWLHPHPKQDIDLNQLHDIEKEVHEMLVSHGVNDDIESITVERMLNKSHLHADAHRFKLSVEGDEYKGVCRDDMIDWFHPKPHEKLRHDEIEKLEEKVTQKVNVYRPGIH